MATITGTNGDDTLSTDAGVTNDADMIFGLDGDDDINGRLGDDTIYGGAGADTINGGDGLHDTVSYFGSASVIVSLVPGASNFGGDAGGDVLVNIDDIVGSGQQDIIRGNDRSNVIDAEGGNDSINGRDGGQDSFFGGDGNDTIDAGGAAGFQISHGGDGNDSIIGGQGDGNVERPGDELYGDAGTDTISGGANGDTIDGGDGADVLHGGGGDDDLTDMSGDGNTLSGDDGNDLLRVGDGASSLSGGDGNDALGGGGGGDTIAGDAGDDFVRGGAGGDSLDGGDGFDELNYLGGDAAITVNLATDAASGGDAQGDAIANFEAVDGTSFNDRLTGDGNANLLEGEQGDDTLTGGAGDDTLRAGAGVDSLDGGSGAHDLADYNGASDAGVAVSLATGLGTAGGAAGDTLTGIEDVEGNSVFADTLVGSSGANLLLGLGGADILQGGAGQDTLDGDLDPPTGLSYAFADTLTGGAGSDRIDGGDGIDTTSYAGSSAAVTVNLAVGSGIGGDAAGDALISIENATGSGFADTLIGSDDANVLDGAAGADSLSGGMGDDFYFVDDAGDRVVEANDGGLDTVAARASYALGTGVHVETMRTTSAGGATAISLTGNEFAQTIFGNAGDNVIDGKGGADTMNGSLGDDTYFVDIAGPTGDQIVENVNGGNDIVAARVSYTLASGVAVETIRTTSNAGTTAINLAGNELDNAIVGNAGTNTLNGHGGEDTMTGLGGADAFVFDRALGADNVDHVTDFAHAIDRIRLDHDVFSILPIGALAASAFKDIADSAEDANDRILYKHMTGALYYDADGAGGNSAVRFATLDDRPEAVTATDFVVIA